jgi:hypothetical protein
MVVVADTLSLRRSDQYLVAGRGRLTNLGALEAIENLSRHRCSVRPGIPANFGVAHGNPPLFTR